MSFRFKVIAVYCVVTLLAVGLCWKIYRLAGEIDDAFRTFTLHDLETLDRAMNSRTNMAEYERLLYEYYATVERTPILVQLALVERTLNENLLHLEKEFQKSSSFQVLKQATAGFSEERNRLDRILSSQPIDWDGARASLLRLSDHGRLAAPAVDEIFQSVTASSQQTQALVEAHLNQMTILVMAFVVVALVAALGVGYATREALRADADRRRLAFFPERSPSPVFSLSLDGEVKYANPSCYRLAARIDENLSSVLPPDIRERIQSLIASGGQSLSYEYRLCDHILSAKLQLLPDLGLCHLYISDVTEQRHAEEELRFIAYHDSLTGLPNRRSFLRDCENWTRKREFPFSVIMVGFLRFELVTRSVGPGVINELLKQVAHRLKSKLDAVPPAVHGTRLYRLSGASYAVLLRTHAADELRSSTDDVAAQLIQGLAQPLTVQRREFCLRPAIGASFCPDDAVAPEALIGSASAALAHLSAANRQGYQPATPQMLETEKVWIETEAAMRHGLERGEFCLHYQPKVSATDSRVTGVEALVRWNRNSAGLVAPGAFIQIAEESGFIVPLGTWVLDESCRQAAAWFSAAHPGSTMAVNVSKLQFEQADFVSVVEQLLRKHDLEPHYLELEITESMLMQDLDRNIAILEALRRLGVELALDDFGVGYSSLEYLRRFPVTRLKIDRTFVTDVANDRRACAVVRAMVDLAHNLDIKVIAEGVETEQQAAALSRLGCDELQGFHFCRPLASPEVVDWWLARDTRRVPTSKVVGV